MDVVRIAKDSLRIAWQRKSLWFFGFFVAAGSGSGGGSNANAASGPGLEALPAWLPLAIAGAALLGIAFLIMHVISEGALIRGTLRARDGGDLPIGEGMREGLTSFWAVFRVKLLLVVVAIGSAAVLSAPAWLFALELLPLAGAITLGVFAVLVGVPWAITLYLVYALALRYVVLDNRHALDAIGKARLFLHGRLGAALLLLLTVGLGHIGAGLAMVICWIPVAILAGLGYLLGGIPVAAVIGAALGLPITIAVVGASGVFQSSVWTLGYLEGRQ